MMPNREPSMPIFFFSALASAFSKPFTNHSLYIFVLIEHLSCITTKHIKKSFIKITLKKSHST